MANKFLPFIVEKSTPLTIYTTLLSRSKGMNMITVAGILYLVLSEGIIKVRDHVKSMDEMPLDKLYEELLVRYNRYRINDEDMQLMMSLKPYLEILDKQRWSTDLDELDLKDIMAFLLVMHLNNTLGDVTDLPLNDLFNEQEKVFNNLPDYVEFSDQGKRITFGSKDDMKAFILWHVFLSEEAVPGPICAVFNDKKVEEGGGDVPF